MLRPITTTETLLAEPAAARQRHALGWFLIATLLVVGTVLLKTYIVLAGGFNLSFDEAYYWHWSKNLDWCYFSKGPGIAVLIRATTSILGDTEFGIRAGAILCSTLSIIVTYFWSARFFDCSKTAVVTLLLFAASPFFTGLGLLTTIDSPLVCCWTLATVSLWQALATRRISWWIAVGLAVGAGIQFKFTMLFFLASLLTTIAISPEHRSLLRTKGPYLAICVAVMSLLPIAIWNTSRDWITLGHTVDKASSAGNHFEITARYIIPSIGQQLGIVSPVMGVGILWATILLLRDASGRGLSSPTHLDARKARFLLGIAAPVLLFYSLLSVHRMVEANWMVVIYVTLIPAAAYYWTRPFRTWQKFTLLAAVIVGLFSHFPFLCGDLLYRTGVPAKLLAAGIPFKSSVDITNRLIGRRELGEEVARRLQELELETGKPAYFIADHYSFAAWVGFYGKMPDRVFVIPSDHVHNQFQLWEKEGRTLPTGASVVVAYDREKGGREVNPLFESMSPEFDTVPVHRAGYEIRQYLFRKAYRYKGSVPVAVQPDPVIKTARMAAIPANRHIVR